MPDPFTFDLSRLRIRTMPSFGGAECVQWAYLLPCGGRLERDIFQTRAGGAGGGSFYDHSSRFPFGLPEEARPLFVEFRAHVAQLTAHQRLAWMAASQAEVAP